MGIKFVSLLTSRWPVSQARVGSPKYFNESAVMNLAGRWQQKSVKGGESDR
jgi:hypothetical protein